MDGRKGRHSPGAGRWPKRTQSEIYGATGLFSPLGKAFILPEILTLRKFGSFDDKEGEKSLLLGRAGKTGKADNSRDRHFKGQTQTSL